MRLAAVVLLCAAATAQAPTAVRPQDDLFGFVNAAWLTATAVPPDRVSDGAFAEIADRTEAQLRDIIEDAIAGRVKIAGAVRQQITALYTSATDEARIEALGAAPLAAELARIRAVDSPSALAAEAGRLSSLGTGGPFDGGPVADPDRPGQTIARVLPGGTLLPDLRYYVDGAPEFAETRRAYEIYLRTVFELTSHDAPGEAARGVLALETAIARAEWPAGGTGTASRRFTLRELAADMPEWDWNAWAKPQGLDRLPAIVVAQPPFFTAFAALVPATPLRVWRDWLAARYATAAAPYLSRPFDMARFRFFGAALTGQVEPRARWKRGVGMVSSYLGDAIGRIYVERHLPGATRTTAQRLLDRVIDAFRVTLRDASIAPASKRDALARLASMTSGVGAPAGWHGYAGLELRPDDLFGNWLRALAFESAGQVRDAGGGTRTWSRPPQAINAYYDPAANQVVVPAALLQPPLFDPAADAASNYGALGALAGHEIAHAFGADEDAADAIGLAVAFRAYRLSLKATAAPLAGLATGDQRFFISWARMWRGKERPEYTRSLAAGRYRSPRDRANAAASSVNGFQDAFDVKAGDGMYRPADRRVRW